MFRNEDAGDFLISKQVESMSLIRKAKRILKVTFKSVHPEMSNDELLHELIPYMENASPVRNSCRHYNGATFYDSTKQIFATHLAV